MIIDIQDIEAVHAAVLPAQMTGFWSAVQNVSTAHREGKHLIVASPESISFFQRAPLDERAVATLNRCAKDFAQSGALLQNPEISEYLVFGNSFIGNSRAIQVPWQSFADSGFVQPIALIAENIADIHFYRVVAEAWLHYHHIRGAQISVQPAPGGGGTTHQIAELIHRERKLCLCILDSDRCSPHAMLGDTAKKVQSTLPDPPAPVFRLRILDECREVENLVSAQAYRKIYQKAPSSFGAIEKHSDLWHFADLKNGTLGHETLQSPNSNTGTYWRRFGVADCKIRGCDHKSCTCKLGVPAPGDIATTASQLAKISVARRWQALSPMSPHLEGIAALVAAWAISPRPLIT